MEELTKRQQAIVQLVSEGLPNKTIAKERGTTENVIKNYLREIFDATGMSNRTELAVWWVRKRFEREFPQELELKRTAEETLQRETV